MAERDDGKMAEQATTGRWTMEQGERAVAAWRRSGLDRAQYCQRSGVARHKLEYWAQIVEAALNAKQRRKQPQAVSLLPVVVRASAAAAVPSGENKMLRSLAPLTSVIEPEWAARFVRALFAGQPS